MKISLKPYLPLLWLALFFACSSAEDPSPSPKYTDAETELHLNNYWDLYAIHLTSNPDSSLFYMQKLKALAEAKNKKEWIASSYWALAYVQTEKGLLSEAIFNYLKVAELFKRAGEMSHLANAYAGIGDIYAKAQDYQTAFLYFEKAKEIFLYEGTNSDKAKTFRNLAICYNELNQNEKAKEALEEGKKYAIEANDYLILSMIYNTWGAVNFKERRFESARVNYKLAFQCADSLKDELRLKASPYNNIGEAYLFEKNYQLAKEWLSNALEIKKKIGDPTYTQSTLNLLGRLRIEQEQYDDAISLFEEGFKNIPSGTVDPAVEEGLALMMEALVKTNAKGTPAQYAHLNKQLATYSQKLMAYNNKLSNLKQQLETTSKQQALQLALEKHTLGNQLEAAEEKNKQIQYAFIIPALLLIAASISVYLAIRRNRNAKQLINAIDDVLNKRHQNIAR